VVSFINDVTWHKYWMKFDRGQNHSEENVEAKLAQL
jgi:hypothetical protein